jgi:DNA-binding CsgD family transcriptional regulator
MAPFILRNPRLPSAPDIKLGDGKTLVGRDPKCHVVLSDSSVSRFHAEFSVFGTDVSISDLGSHNGTFLDGERVQSSQQVRAGQQLHLGCVVFQVIAAGVGGSEGEPEPETQSISDVFEPPPAAADRLPLSAAERRVFDLILSGHAEKEVANRLEISRHTVHCHVRKIYRTLHVRSRAELLAKYVRLPNGSTGPAGGAPPRHDAEQ